MLWVVAEGLKVLDMILSQLIERSLCFLFLQAGSLGGCCRPHLLVGDKLKHVINTVLDAFEVAGGLQSVMIEQLKLGQLVVLEVLQLLLDLAGYLLEGLLLLEVEHLVFLLEEFDVVRDTLRAKLGPLAGQHVGKLLVLDLDLQLGRALLLTGLDQLLHLLDGYTIVDNVQLTAEHLVLALQLTHELLQLFNLGLVFGFLLLHFAQGVSGVTSAGLDFLGPLALVLFEIRLVHLQLAHLLVRRLILLVEDRVVHVEVLQRLESHIADFEAASVIMHLEVFIGLLKDRGDNLESVLHALDLHIFLVRQLLIVLVGLLELVSRLMLVELEPLVHPLDLALGLIRQVENVFEEALHFHLSIRQFADGILTYGFLLALEKLNESILTEQR